jgi:hypothetical protein
MGPIETVSRQGCAGHPVPHQRAMPRLEDLRSLPIVNPSTALGVDPRSPIGVPQWPAIAPAERPYCALLLRGGGR